MSVGVNASVKICLYVLSHSSTAGRPSGSPHDPEQDKWFLNRWMEITITIHANTLKARLTAEMNLLQSLGEAFIIAVTAFDVAMFALFDCLLKVSCDSKLHQALITTEATVTADLQWFIFGTILSF